MQTIKSTSTIPFTAHLHGSKRRPMRLDRVTVCQSSASQDNTASEASRRQALLSLAAVALATTFNTGPSGAAQLTEFVPDSKKTPAIRAGTVDPNNPYRFAIPQGWKEQKVANIQSGNYCQPRCAEPWTEVIFQGDEGRAQVIVSPLVRLTNKEGAAIDDIGTTDGVIESLGPFMTGTYLDSEDVVSGNSVKYDGRTYYQYELNVPYGTVGPRILSSATTKGDLALLFIVSASEKQWGRNEQLLREVVQTFRA